MPFIRQKKVCTTKKVTVVAIQQNILVDVVQAEERTSATWHFVEVVTNITEPRYRESILICAVSYILRL